MVLLAPFGWQALDSSSRMSQKSPPTKHQSDSVVLSARSDLCTLAKCYAHLSDGETPFLPILCADLPCGQDRREVLQTIQDASKKQLWVLKGVRFPSFTDKSVVHVSFRSARVVRTC